MKTIITICLILALGLVCSCQTETSKVNQETIAVTDGLGREVIVPKHPKRLLSLASSMTEMLSAVCDSSQIAGITHTCNYPEFILSKPIVTTYPLDFEAIISINPDLIFTIEGMTNPDHIKRLEELGYPVVVQAYQTVDNVFEGILEIGHLTRNDRNAHQIVDSLLKDLDEIAQSVSQFEKPRVLCITWHDPVYAYGNNTIMTDKLKYAGGLNAIDEILEAPYPALSREYILKLNPDVMFGGDFGRMDSTFFKLYPELKKINAYRNKRIYGTTDDLTSRPSPRVLESIREYRTLLHS